MIKFRLPKYRGFKALKPTVILVLLLLTVTSLGYFYGLYKREFVAHAQTIVTSEMVREEASRVREENQNLKSLLRLNPGGKVVIVNDGSAKSKAMFKARKVFGDGHLASFEKLINSESGFNPSAQNKTSTAFGMFQFLDSTWKSYNCEKTEEVDHQIECGIKYISQRYGNPNNAWEFWLEHHYY